VEEITESCLRMFNRRQIERELWNAIGFAVRARLILLKYEIGMELEEICKNKRNRTVYLSTLNEFNGTQVRCKIRKKNKKSSKTTQIWRLFAKSKRGSVAR
jgi:hypothetical protein